MIEELGAKAVEDLSNMGRFGRFVWRTIAASGGSIVKTTTYPLIWTQMNIIGVHSVPVVMITGAFVGMILAVMAY